MFEKIGKYSNEWAIAFNSIGLFYDNEDKHIEALEYFNRALTMFE